MTKKKSDIKKMFAINQPLPAYNCDSNQLMYIPGPEERTDQLNFAYKLVDVYINMNSVPVDFVLRSAMERLYNILTLVSDRSGGAYERVRTDSKLVYDYVFQMPGGSQLGMEDFVIADTLIETMSWYDYTDYHKVSEVLMPMFAKHIKALHPVLSWTNTWMIVRKHAPELIRKIMEDWHLYNIFSL